MEIKKEKPQPTNVKPVVKSFLINQKAILRQRLGRFVSEEGVLMHYLTRSEEFNRDFEEYCKAQNRDVDLLSVLTQ